MKIAKNDIEVKIQIPGAIMRQRMDFGDVTGFGKMGAEFFSLSAGVDTTQLFKGLENDLCQCPHWGYVLSGQIKTVDSDDIHEVVNPGDLFYWPAGHNVIVTEDVEIIMFSPQHEHNIVLNHMIEKLKE